MSSRSRQQLEAYLKDQHIVAERVLDVGGSQKPVAGRLGALSCKSYEILDLTNPHETEKRPEIVADINDMFLRSNMQVFEGVYDLVFCLEVMEYVFDPMTTLKNLAFFMKKDGTLIISFPFVYPVHNPLGMDYLRYTEFGARKLIEMAGLQEVETFYRTADGRSTMNFYQSEGMRPSRDYKHHDAVGFVFKCIKK